MAKTTGKPAGEVQNNEVQGNEVQGNEVQGNEVQGNEVQGNEVQNNEVQNNEVQKKDQNGLVAIQCTERAGKQIYASSGKIISFDEKGNALVSEADALYLKNFPNIKF